MNTISRLKDDIYLFNTGEAQRAYRMFGCHQNSRGNFTFCLWAPNAKKVSVVGDFNEWNPDVDVMQCYNGIWFVEIKGASKGDNYKYAVTSKSGKTVLKADPFAFHSETRPGNASKIWKLEGYQWHDKEYLLKRARRNHHVLPMSIYEMHLGSWRTKEGYEFPSIYELADEVVKYIKEMGFTHIELMPIEEFPFDGSWGYQVTGYYSVTSRYGSPQDYMYFIDKMHENGIGVIIDWVPAHFPRDEHGLAKFDGTCLYEHPDPLIGEHPQWGTLVFNYAKPEVVSFLISNAIFWFDYYHVDGIRVDAVSSMLYLDFGRDQNAARKNVFGGNYYLEAIDFLRKLNSTVHTLYKGCLMIAEESSAYPKVTGEVKDGGLGFDYKWNMGFMNDTLEYFSMDCLFRKYHHNLINFPMMYAASEHFILPYSHDECVHGKKSMVDKMSGDYWQKFANLRALYGFMYAHPGKKLMFMGDEFAHFAEWSEKHELDWFLLDYDSHRKMQKYVRDINKFYSKNRSFYELEESWDGFTWLIADDNENSAAAFIRLSKPRSGKIRRTVCVFNFTPVVRYNYKIGLPFAGKLEEKINSDDIKYGGSGVSMGNIETDNIPFGGFRYSASIILPPLAAVYYDYKIEDENLKQEGD